MSRKYSYKIDFTIVSKHEALSFYFLYQMKKTCIRVRYIKKDKLHMVDCQQFFLVVFVCLKTFVEQF